MNSTDVELSKGGRSLLQGRGDALNTLETEGQMLQRVLPDLMGMKNIMVINDEAHHCYREKPHQPIDDDLKGDDRKEAAKLLRSACLLIAALFIFLPAAVAEHEGKVQILLLGDSTTEGSIPRLLKPEGPHLERVLEKLLAVEEGLPPCHVINSSLSGEYIRRLIDQGRYQKNGAKLPGIDYIFIRYGINDRARLENFSENFPKDFHELIKILRKDHPKALIIPTTVIPYSSKENSKEINDLVRQVAKAEKLKVFDIYPGYAKALEKGPKMLNYRRYPLEKIPKQYHEWLKPRIHGGRVVVMDNELDALFGHLPGWTGDSHPNLAGYNVIAVETAKYLTPILKARGK